MEKNGKIKLSEVMLHPNRYNLYLPDDSSPVDKIVDILESWDAKDFYAKKRKEMTRTNRRSSYKSIRGNLNRIVREKTFDGLTLSIAMQYGSSCKHKEEEATSEIVKCDCYKLARSLFSGVKVVVGFKNGKRKWELEVDS